MGKLLRVLVVILLLLSIGSLVLGILLFNKREILKGRTNKLETAVTALGLTIESESAEARQPDFTAKDISACEAQLVDTPEISDFWDTYKVHLEDQDLSKVDVKSQELDLMSYYKSDPVTRRPAKDAMGRRIMSGPGTMQQVLDDLLARAGDQYDRLNETRQQLTDLREEMERTVDELNTRKGELRQALVTIEELRAEIARLNDEIANLKDQIAQLQEEKQALQDELAEKTREIDTLHEEIDEKDAIIDDLKEKLAERPTTPETGLVIGPDQQIAPPVRPDMPHGDKGRVVAIDRDWDFLVLEFDPQFLKDMLGEDLSAPLPAVELFVKRPGDSEEFVTKVRLIQVRRDKGLGVADVIPGWTQLPAKKGDVVFY